MRAQDVDLVRQLPLFQNSEPNSFEMLVAAGYVQRFPAGVTLVHEGEHADFLHVLIDGQVNFFATHHGREATISVLTPPATFILAAVITDGPYLKSARTLVPTTTVLIPAAAVRTAFETDTAFARATVKELACRYRAITKELKNQRLRTALERLANWILKKDSETGGTGCIELVYEKRILAGELGMRPENLSRAFAELADIGVVVSGPVIRIQNHDKLVAFSNPSPLIDGVESCGGI